MYTQQIIKRFFLSERKKEIQVYLTEKIILTTHAYIFNYRSNHFSSKLKIINSSPLVAVDSEQSREKDEEKRTE